jgi:hypothetical protein
MKYKWIILALTSLFILSLTACTTPISTTESDTFKTVVAQSVQLTQLAGSLTAVAQQPAQEQTTMVAVTPTETLTPQPSITPTLQGTWLTFLTNTNCRIGPGKSYYLVKTFNAYDSAEAVGRSEDNQYVFVTYTDTAQHYCWVIATSSEIKGDIASLRAMTAIPTSTPTITPTPDVGVSVTFNGLSSCGANYYVRLQVKNTGYLTWQSIKIKITDKDTGDTITESSDDFVGYGGCGVEISQADLTTYEYGIVSNNANFFDHDLDNHKLSITVTVYASDGLGGKNMTQSFEVTP